MENIYAIGTQSKNWFKIGDNHYFYENVKIVRIESKEWIGNYKIIFDNDSTADILNVCEVWYEKE